MHAKQLVEMEGKSEPFFKGESAFSEDTRSL